MIRLLSLDFQPCEGKEKRFQQKNILTAVGIM